MANDEKKFIKQINLGTADTPNLYYIYDEYARRRLEGLSNVYSISCQHAGASTNSYVDYITGAAITYTDMAIANTSFTSDEETIKITKTDKKTTYIVLESKTASGAYYAVRFLDMNIGDTVYVVEAKVGEVNVPDRWLSNYVEDESATFTVLEGKIDLKEYAKKSEAGKAGTYTPTIGAAGEGATGSAGSQTATGTATVTYKLAATVTGENGAGASDNTGTAGGVTVSGSNFEFTGTAATITASVTGVVLNDHSYTPSGSVVLTPTAASTGTAVTSVSAALADAPAFTGTEATISSEGSYQPAGAISGSQTISAHTHTVTLTPTDANKETVLTAVPEPTLGGTTSFNTDAIKSAALTGTTTFNTDAIKSAELTGTTTFNTDAIKSASLDVADAAEAGRQAVVSAVAPSLSGNTSPVKSVDAATGEAGAHTHEVDSHAHADNEAVVKSITFAANGDDSFTANGDDTFTAATISYASAATGSALSSATVDATGVLSFLTSAFNTDATKIAAFDGGAFTQGAKASFTQGTKATLSYATVSVAGAGSAATLTSKNAGAHTHSVGSSTASISVAANATTKYVKVATAAASSAAVGLTTTAATSASFGITTTAASKGTVSISRASVSMASVLKSLPAAVVTEAGTATVNFTNASFTGTTTTVAVSGTYTPAGSVSKPNVNVTASTSTFATEGIKSATATFTGTSATIAHSFADGGQGVINATYTPAGTIGGSQTIAAHSHSYTKPTAHTHTIALTDTAITGTASVAVSAHTHTLGNHTHSASVTIPNCSAS